VNNGIFISGQWEGFDMGTNAAGEHYPVIFIKYGMGKVFKFNLYFDPKNPTGLDHWRNLKEGQKLTISCAWNEEKKKLAQPQIYEVDGKPVQNGASAAQTQPQPVPKGPAA
jgi:hypothetical protein